LFQKSWNWRISRKKYVNQLRQNVNSNGFNIQITKFIKSWFSVISPSYTPMIKFSSTSTIFFSKMLLKMCFNSSKTFYDTNNKIIVPKELKLKNIQKEIRKPITPKCQFKWDTIYEKKFNWISIWYILNKIKCKQSIIQFQWKCLHLIHLRHV
jgi:hypothetical protein